MVVLTTLLFVRSLFALIDAVCVYGPLDASTTYAARQPNRYAYHILGAICFTLLALRTKHQRGEKAVFAALDTDIVDHGARV